MELDDDSGYGEGYYDYNDESTGKEKEEKEWEELSEKPPNAKDRRRKLLDMRDDDRKELLDFIAKETLLKIEENYLETQPSRFELVYKRGMDITIKYGENNRHTITVYFDSCYKHYDLLINTLIETGKSLVQDNLLAYFKFLFDGHFNEDYLVTFQEFDIVFSHFKGLSIVYNVVILNEGPYRIGGEEYEAAKERYGKDIAKFSKK